MGATICCLGQMVSDIIRSFYPMMDLFTLGAWSSIIVVVITICLTAFGCFDRLAKFGGAGTFIPISGFANSIVSPAMEYKSEGYVMGVGAKMFTVAGPVLVYGISTSVIVGLLYLLFNVQSITLV